MQAMARQPQDQEMEQVEKGIEGLGSPQSPDMLLYNATIQHSTAVTKAVRARFTYKYQPEVYSELKGQTSNQRQRSGSADMLDQPSAVLPVEVLEDNLVTISGTLLKVYAIDQAQGHVDLRMNFSFNDRIVDVLKVPTEKISRAQQEQKQNKKKLKRRIDIEMQDVQQLYPDYLFVLTETFSCALLAYDQRAHRIEVISRGNIADKSGGGERREPPYSIFLTPCETRIVMMLYENVIKAIPLVQSDTQNARIKMSCATNVRVRHSEVLSVSPVYTSQHSTEFGVLYQRIAHDNKGGRPVQTLQKEFEKQEYQPDRGDLVPVQHQKFTFSSNTVYRVEPLAIGGFLVFDIDCIAYVREDLTCKTLFQRKLRVATTVSAFVQVDSFNRETGLTEEHSSFMRYLFASETGDLYLLGFQLDLLQQIKQQTQPDQRAENSFMNVEFLASKLSDCSSLVYLGNSCVFYSSKQGDSYILKIWSEPRAATPDQPYITTEQTFESLAPISDLNLRSTKAKKGQKNEYVVVSGLNHRTHMNIVKLGVSLRDIFSFDKILSANLVQRIYSINGALFLRIFGYDQLIALKVNYRAAPSHEEKAELSFDGVDLSREYAVRGHEEILCLQAAKPVGTDQCIVYATETGIKLMGTLDKQDKLYKNIDFQAEATHVSVLDDLIVVALKNGCIKFHRLQAAPPAEDMMIETGPEALILNSFFTATKAHQVSAIKLTRGLDESSQLAYICYYDAPLYSVEIWSVQEKEARCLVTQSLAMHLEPEQVRAYYENKFVYQGKVFNKLKDDSDNQQSIVNFEYTCSAAKQIELLHVDQEQTDYLILGIGTGKILQFTVDLAILGRIQNSGIEPQIIDEPGSADHQSDEKQALWGAQVTYVGTLLPKLSHVTTQNGPAVVAACDRPVIYYVNPRDNNLEMQYLCTDKINQMTSLVCGGESFLVYENAKGILQVGECDGLQQLKIKRMLFKKQITKSFILPEKGQPDQDSDQIVALLEEQDFAYLDETKPDAVNVIAVISRINFKASAMFRLKKGEIPNCIHHMHEMGLVVGTTFLNPEEQMPSAGRLLLFEPYSLNLLQEFAMEGSVQAITTAINDKYLVVGINNLICAYALSQKGQQYTLELLDQKVSGTFIQSIVTLPRPPAAETLISSAALSLPTSIVVGDMAVGGIMTYELKEGRASIQSRLRITESASSHLSMWVTCIVPLSSSDFAVFDQHNNVYIFRKCLLPSTIEEKYKLKLQASYCLGDEVKTAMTDRERRDDKEEAGKRGRVYKKAKDREMIDTTKEEAANLNYALIMRSDLPSARRVTQEALQEAQGLCELASRDIQQGMRLLYGTASGSIGVFFSVSALIHAIMEQLYNAMDKQIDLNRMLCSRSHFRAVKGSQNMCQIPPSAVTLALEPAILKQQQPKNVIDGDFVESFLEQPRQKQLEIVGKFTFSQSPMRGDDHVTDNIISLVQAIQKLH